MGVDQALRGKDLQAECGNELCFDGEEKLGRPFLWLVMRYCCVFWKLECKKPFANVFISPTLDSSV